ncbi:DUF3304 domain-containing protein [Cupriavidus taiwanensis]|uniref:DUF3304 domain-containing protein n=1 Tax=Cupriavidus taiwanensis TaxID=164546 RepID=UPI002541A9B7|nr:DUF3304 domain-containing protein [Cupriavidus taiwanensis]MDK3021621.1 DUF3304 domain-containing protein [Cupriavidus taiwanensis]
MIALGKRARAVLVVVAMALAIAGCGKAEAPEPVGIEEDDSLGGLIGVLNYTDVPIGVVYVNGEWAGGMVANAGGTKWIGGISVPKQWDPNFKVAIKWSDDELFEKDEEALYTKELSIEKYPPAGGAYFYVAFYPNHEVKLYLTRGLPGYKGDPYDLEDPTDACLKRKAPTERENCYAPEFRENYRRLQSPLDRSRPGPSPSVRHSSPHSER